MEEDRNVSLFACYVERNEYTVCVNVPSLLVLQDIGPIIRICVTWICKDASFTHEQS
jgi:hypothetical protein